MSLNFFLSYSVDDGLLANQLIETLSRRGHYQFSHYTERNDQNWKYHVSKMLADAYCLICILGDKSDITIGIRWEIEHAHYKQLPIVVLGNGLEACKLPEGCTVDIFPFCVESAESAIRRIFFRAPNE
jgi:hypothetical protein